jgi:lambda family phage portal protein
MTAPGRIGAIQRYRVPAERVLHTALAARMRPGQTRGISWLAPVGSPIYQLGQYRQAEIIAAREAASVNGWYKQPAGEDGFSGDFSDVDEHGYLEDVEAGEKRILPPGWEYHVAESQHPTTAFEPFSKSLIRSIASGFGLSYESVASDLSGASYSSGRIGALEDRQVFRTLQAWEIETLLDPIWPIWLEEAAVAGAFRLSSVDFDRLLPVRWATRGWSWVDPQKEGSGNQIGLDTKTRLVSDIVADATGRTLEEHADMLAEEIEIFEEKGLVHPSAAAPVAPPGDQDELEGESEDDDE